MEKNMGAFVCDGHVFNRILRLAKRRGDQYLFLVITFDSVIKNSEFEKLFDNINLLLRSKDVITRNQKEIFILLNNANLLYGEDIVNRFNTIFETNHPEINPVFTLKEY